MRKSILAACLSMAFLGQTSWAAQAIPFATAQGYPISSGKTGEAAERRAAKKRRNAKRRW